jgi:DHA1 family multidrug resistance protein-like MFS transporter
MISSEPISNNWQKNLYAMFIAELVVMAGFSFVFPFMPLYIEKLGNYTYQQAAFWAGIAEGTCGIAMFLASPLWGLIADRMGRKPMVLRAIFGSAVVVALIAISPNVPFLIMMRFFQGVLSGTVAAASALVASMTPREKRPFAMGLLMTGIYVGNSCGPLLGGLAADKFGYETTFFIAACALAAGGFVVLFLVKEKFEPVKESERSSIRSMLRLAGSKEVLSLLIIQFALSAGPSMVGPIIPLFIQQLNPLGQAATESGIALTLAGIIAAVSATVAGRLTTHLSLKIILVFSCLGTCLAYLAPMTATNVTQLTIYIALRGLLNGGILTASYALLSLSVSPNQQGVVFGLGQSANSLGGGVGPTIGGALGSSLGLKNVFGFTAGMYLFTTLLVIKVIPKHAGEKTETTPKSPGTG